MPKPQPSVLKRLKEQKRHERQLFKAQKRSKRQSDRRERRGPDQFEAPAPDSTQFQSD